MIIVAFVFSIGACIGKIAVQHSDPSFFQCCLLISIVFFFLSGNQLQEPNSFYSKVAFQACTFSSYRHTDNDNDNYTLKRG